MSTEILLTHTLNIPITAKTYQRICEATAYYIAEGSAKNVTFESVARSVIDQGLVVVEDDMKLCPKRTA